MASHWMNSKQLTEHLGLKSVSTLYRWIKKGVIPSGQKLNGGIRTWSPADLEAIDGTKIDRTQEIKARIKNAPRETFTR